MNYKQVKKLKPGDKVFWTDPASLMGHEHTSREIVIQDVQVNGEVVCILGENCELECLPQELKLL